MMDPVSMRKTHQEMDSFDVDEGLELNGVEESMSLLSLSIGESKDITSSTDDISVDLTGFFFDDDDDGHEEISYGGITDDAEEGVGDKLDYFKSGSDSNEVVNNANRLLRRRYLHGSRKKSSNACNAIGASVITGYQYKSPLSDYNKHSSKPIDIVYGDADQCRQFSQSKKTRSRRRSLYRASREDWREKAWERKRDQVLSEEFTCDYNYFSDFQYSKTASDSASEEARADSPNSTIKRTSSASRVRKLTNVDLDELKGCLDLGFGFNYEEMPELSHTLPALELCYAIGQKFQDDHHQKSSPVSTLDNMDSSNNEGYPQSPIANWKISSPGDHPQQVKERLKVWAQAVACTVRLCT